MGELNDVAGFIRDFCFFAKKAKMVLGKKNGIIVLLFDWENIPLVISEIFKIKKNAIIRQKIRKIVKNHQNPIF